MKISKLNFYILMLKDGWEDLNEEERKLYYVGNDYDVGRGNFEDLH